MTINFFIQQEGRKSRRELHALQTWADAVGVEQLENPDQLHGKRFKLIVWDGWSWRFSFRPAP